MRNVVILLMLTILTLSIFSVFWKNLYVPKENKTDDAQTSRVEKLVKGEDSVKSSGNSGYKYYLEHYNQQIDTSTSILQKTQIKPQTSSSDVIFLQEKQITNKEIQDEDIANMIKNAQNIDLNNVSVDKIQEISAELNKKYGNNPNAEVSEEDLQKIIEKILTPQNR